MSSPDNQVTQELRRFIAKEKFRAHGLYSGVQPIGRMTEYEARVNQLAERLLLAMPPLPTKPTVLAEFQSTLKLFDEADSEDSDQLLDYLSELMDIFGIESSDGLLNIWRYGFDPKKTTEQNNQDAVARMSVEERDLAASFGALKPESALRELSAKLGPPSSVSTTTQLWILNAQRQTAVTLNLGPPKVIVGLLRARTYSYFKQLGT